MPTTVVLSAITEMQTAQVGIEEKIASLTFLASLPFTPDLETEITKILGEMQAMDNAIIAAVAALQALLALNYPFIPTDAVPGNFLAELKAKILQIEQAESVFQALIVGPPAFGEVRFSTPTL